MKYWKIPKGKVDLVGILQAQGYTVSEVRAEPKGSGSDKENLRGIYF